MRWIVESSLKLHAIVIILAVGLIVYGITQLRDLPMNVLPEFKPTTVRVQTEALGLSAEEVEQFITAPLEQDLLNGVAFLQDIRSESVPGLSNVDLIFEPGTDVFVARQVVQERLTQAHALPNVSTPPQMIQPISSTGRVMMISLTSEEVPMIDMSVLARWTIKPRLIGVPGVANVSIWGMRDQELQVRVDPAALQSENISLRTVVETTANALWTSPLSFVEASTPGTGGWIETSNQRLQIQHELPINTPEDLSKVVIERQVDGPLVIGDIAEVVRDHQPLIGDAVVDDGQGLLIVIEKFPWANTLEVTDAVDGAMDELEPGLDGIDVDSTVFRAATFIELSADNLSRGLLIGTALVLLTLILFVFNWRVALISIVAIPSSLLAAGFVINITSGSVNAVMVAGLAAALLIVIDSAVVDVDNIARRLGQNTQSNSGRSTLAVVLDASSQIRYPMVYVTLILLLTMLPVVFLGGVSGAFFQPLAISYSIGILTAFVVALTLTPVLSWILLAKTPLQHRESPVVRVLRGVYIKMLSGIVSQKVIAPAAAVVLAVVAIVSVLFLRQDSLVPPINDPGLLLQWEAPPGTSLPEMHRITTEVTRSLRGIPEVDNVGAHVGRSITGDQIVGVNSGQIWVNLDPEDDYRSAISAIQQVTERYPGLFRGIDTYPEAQVKDALKGPTEPITVRIYGDDLSVLRSQAEAVQQALSGVPGLTNLHVKQPIEQPTLEIKVDLASAERFGIKPGDVRRAAAVLLSGLVVGNLFEGQKVFDVVVWGTLENRQDLESIRQLLIDSPGGNQVRLEQVAEVKVVNKPMIIERESSSRFIDVAADVRGRDAASVAGDVRGILRDLTYPYEYHAVLLANIEEQRAVKNQTISIVIASIIGIVLLLQAAFRSWLRAALMVLALLSALSGGMIGALISGGNLSVGVYAGFLGLLGFAASQGIVMFRNLQYLEQEEGEEFGPGLARRGAQERFGPIITSAVAGILFFLPFVVSGNGVPGNEMLFPLALVVVFGLITSTLTNLFLVPVLYLLSGPSRTWETIDQEVTTGQPVTSH